MSLAAKTNKTWVTLVTNDFYIVGADVLLKSLRKVGSKYPLLILVPSDAATVKQKLIQNGHTVCEVAPMPKEQNSTGCYIRPEFGNVFLKLWAFGMTEYEKMVFIDSDMLVVQNMDELFDLDCDIAACQTCICNPSEQPRYPSNWKPENCPYSSCSLQTALSGSFSMDENSYFNAGLIFFKPGPELFTDMMATLKKYDLSLCPFAEQDFLNMYFKGRWKSIPFIYNALKTYTKSHPDIWQIDSIKNIHYIISKPWDILNPSNKDYEKLNALWNRIYKE